LSREHVYVMAESATTYFEAYRHVLSALQKVDLDRFPFQDYLLRWVPARCFVHAV
jgi:hypothetical protein